MYSRKSDGLKPAFPKVALVCLTLLAFGLRIIGARSSIAYIPDTQIIREALDLGQQHSLQQIFDINLNNELKYPLTLPYYLLGVYGLIFAVGFVFRIFPDLKTFITFLFTQRETIHLIAVLALAVITTAAVPVAFIVSKRLNRNHTGWLAAGLVAFDLLSVQMSHQARPHAPLAALAFITVVLLCSFTVSQGGWLNSLAATLLTALTFGTLQSGAVVLVPYGLAWLIRLSDAWRARRFWPEARIGILNLVALAGLLFLLYPPVFTEYPRFVYNIVTGSPQYTLGGGSHVFERSNFGLQYIPAFVSGWFGYQPLQVLLFPFALTLFIWDLRSQWRILVVGLPLPVINLIMWAIYYDNSPRFWATLALFNALLCAYLIEEVIVWSARTINLNQWRLVGAALLIVVMPAFINAIRLDVVMSQPDTRTLASEWVKVHIPANATVIGNFQMLELLPNQDSLRRQNLDYPGSLGTYAQWLLSQDAATYPPGPAFDIVDFGLYWFTHPSSSLIKDLKIQYVVAQTNSSDLTQDQALIAYTQQYGQPLQVFCPGLDVKSTYLPIDIYGWAWQEIWKVDRPGPIVIVYQLGNAQTAPPKTTVCQH